jgi:hypothetical protein
VAPEFAPPELDRRTIREVFLYGILPLAATMDCAAAFADAEREFPVRPNQFPVPQKIFPVRLRREFDQKGQSILTVRAAHQSQQRPESRKFPVFSLGIRESSAENGSLVTARSAN